MYQNRSMTSAIYGVLRLSAVLSNGTRNFRWRQKPGPAWASLWPPPDWWAEALWRRTFSAKFRRGFFSIGKTYEDIIILFRDFREGILWGNRHDHCWVARIGTCQISSPILLGKFPLGVLENCRTIYGKALLFLSFSHEMRRFPESLGADLVLEIICWIHEFMRVEQWRLGRSDAGVPDAVGGTPTTWQKRIDSLDEPSEISKKWFLFLRCMMYAVWIPYII